MSAGINNFDHFLMCRLITPGKSDIGVLSKEHIDNINKILREKTNVNQLRNTDAVVTWFKNIENKHISSFIKLDIIDFYPSISKDLLMNSINFAKCIGQMHNTY